MNYERKNETTATKDGAVINPGGLIATLEIKALASNDPVNNMLMSSVINGEKLEIWEIDISAPTAPEASTYNALYMRGNLKSWSVPAPTEGPVEINTSADIDGTPQSGLVTFTPEELDEIQYAFRDLAIVG